MVRRLRLVALLQATLASAALAAPPPALPSAQRDAALRRNVERLVGELDSPMRGTRNAAAESLLRLGPDILPLLPAARSLSSPAAGDALRQIQNKLERTSATAGVAASRVTLNGPLPFVDALRAFTAQTGNEFDASHLSAATLQRRVSLAARARPFWDVWDDVAKQAEVIAAAQSEPRKLVLSEATGAGPAELAVSRDSSVRVAVKSASLRSAVGAGPRLLRIGWELRCEPRLRPLFVKVAGRELVAVAGTTRLEPLSPNANLELSLGEGPSPLRITTDFVIPAKLEVEKIEFRGSATIEMAAGPRRIVFDDLVSNRAQDQRAGAVTVGLRKVEFTAAPVRSLRVGIIVVYDQGGPAFESYRTWITRNEAVLETKDGRRLRPEPLFATRQQGDGSIAVEYNFAHVDGSPAQFRFVYVAPTALIDLPAGFEFSTIPVEQGPAKGRKP